MNSLNNEKGLTLLEVILSIVILTIILVSVISILPQMGFMNRQNIDKQQAINTARETLYDFQKKAEVRSLIKSPMSSSNFVFIKTKDDLNYFKYTQKINKWDVYIKIKTIPDVNDSGGKELYQIHIELMSENGLPITETYGYIVPE